jgi:hypothetical protein
MRWRRIMSTRVTPKSPALRSLVQVVGWRYDGKVFYVNKPIVCATERDWKFAEKSARSELNHYLHEKVEP